MGTFKQALADWSENERSRFCGAIHILDIGSKTRCKASFVCLVIKENYVRIQIRLAVGTVLEQNDRLSKQDVDQR
jgi:hypothetical protein